MEISDKHDILHQMSSIMNNTEHADSLRLTREYQFSEYSIPIFTHLIDVTNPMPLHTHDFSELVFILAGHATHRLNDKVFEVVKGDIFLIVGNTPHCFDNCNGLRLINIMFNAEDLHLPLENLIEKPGFRAFFDLEPQLRELHDFSNHLVVSPEDMHYLERIHGDLLKELENSSTGSEIIPRAILVHLISTLSDLYAEFDQRKRFGYTALCHILYFIEQHFSEQIRLNDIIAASNMSSSTLLRRFKEVFNTTPMNYLKEFRIQKSIDLLSDPQYTITNIALDCGFSNVNHFSREFHEIIGVAPSVYRKATLVDDSNSPGLMKRS